MFGAPIADETALFAAIFSILRRRSSLDFSVYKETTVRRRVAFRMAIVRCSMLTDYVILLSNDRGEALLLVHALLVKTTTMFRDPATFTRLLDNVLPALFRQQLRRGAHTLRAWVPACATGEEAYSLAMCLLATQASLGTHFTLSVLASDIDRTALERVARGVVKPSKPWGLRSRRLRLAGFALIITAISASQKKFSPWFTAFTTIL